MKPAELVTTQLVVPPCWCAGDAGDEPADRSPARTLRPHIFARRLRYGGGATVGTDSARTSYAAAPDRLQRLALERPGAHDTLGVQEQPGMGGDVVEIEVGVVDEQEHQVGCRQLAGRAVDHRGRQRMGAGLREVGLARPDVGPEPQEPFDHGDGRRLAPVGRARLVAEPSTSTRLPLSALRCRLSSDIERVTT
jgi:hypothetical protein